MSEEEKKVMENDILFQIDMELYDKFNDKFCAMNEYLGEIYSYADLKDLEDSRNATEINLLRQAIKKQQKEMEDIYNDYQDLRKECYELQEELNQEKEKNKELYEIKYIASTFIERTMSQFSVGEFRYKVNNSISKDKIQKKIKEIENYTNISNEEMQQQDYAIIKLEELLEE